MKIFKLFFILIMILSIQCNAQFTISGVVTDTISYKPLVGVSIKINQLTSLKDTANSYFNFGTVTNSFGKYDISIPPGLIKLTFSHIGYQSKTIELDINQNKILNISLNTNSSELNLLVVSASKFKQKIEEVTVSMDVIDSKLIESKNCITLTDLIRNVPSIQLIDGQLNIRSGSGWSYGTGSRVLVMVDQMPILSADQGEVDFNLIPMENIEQIEVIKGASSALYGSSALNGIINIKTKTPSFNPQTTVSSFVGFWDSPKDPRNNWWGDSLMLRNGISLSHSKKIKNLDLTLSANHYNDRGYIKFINNQQTRISANSKLIKDKVTFGLNLNYMQRKSGLFVMWKSDTNAYIPLSGTNIPNNGNRFYIDPSITYYHNSFKHTLRSRVLSRNLFYNDNPNNKNNSLLSFNEYQNQFQDENTTITSGITLVTQKGETNSFNSQYTQDGKITGLNYSAYLQLDQKINKINFSIGGRFEYFDLNNTKFGQPVIRGGLNYEISNGWNLRSSFGQGFRFPTMTELYFKGDIGPINLYNNPDLTPESGWTSELGLKKVIKIRNFKGYIDLVGFLMEYNDMMEFTLGIWGPPEPSSYGLGFSSKNVNKARIPGLEFTINASGLVSDNWSLGLLFGVTYSNPYSVYPDSSFEDLLPLDITQISLAEIALNESNPSKYTFSNTSSSANNSTLKYRSKANIRLDLEIVYKSKLTIGISYQFNSKMTNIDYAFVTGLFNENTLISTDLGINRSMLTLNKGYSLLDYRVKYNFKDNITVGLLCENLFNNSYLIRPANLGSPRTFMFQVQSKF
jgi:iron complex outermembrane receptor protein